MSLSNSFNKVDESTFARSFSSFLSSLSNDPSQWSDEQSDIMFLINLFPRAVRPGENTYQGQWGYPGLVDDLLSKTFVDMDEKSWEDDEKK